MKKLFWKLETFALVSLLMLLENFVHRDRHRIPTHTQTHRHTPIASKLNWYSELHSSQLSEKRKEKNTAVMHRQMNNWDDSCMPTTCG